MTYSTTGAYCKQGHRSARQSIDDLQECKNAAKELDYPFKDSRSKAIYPKGCYLFEPTSRTYFNTHTTGGYSDQRAKQVCIEKGKFKNYLTTSKILFNVYSVEIDYRTPISPFLLVIYVASGYNEYCSDTDELLTIDKADECKLAADDLKLPYFGPKASNSFPTGCCYNRIKKLVYYNTNNHGARAEDGQVICKKTGYIDGFFISAHKYLNDF